MGNNTERSCITTVYSCSDTCISMRILLLCIQTNMRFSLSIFTCLISSVLFAQSTWVTAYGAGGQDNAYSVERTFDGNYLVAGSTGSFGSGNSDAYLIKTDTSGAHLWSRYYGGTEIEEIRAVTTAADSGIIMVGHTNGWGNGGYDILMIKTDTAGNQLWDRTFGGPSWEFGMDVELLPDGGFLICGSTYSFGNGNSDIYLVRTDANGDTLWTKTVGSSGIEQGNSIHLVSGGGALIVGNTNSTGNGGSDAFLVKINNQGDTLWTRTFGGAEDDHANDVIELSNGNIAFAGSTASFDPDLTLLYYVMTDSFGGLIWENSAGSPGNCEGHAMIEDRSGRILIAAYNDYWGTGGKDSWLYITDQTGNYLSAPTCGGLMDEVIFDLDTTLGGGIIQVGTTESYGSGQKDVVLIGSDQNGPMNCQGADVVYDPLFISEFEQQLGNLKLWPNPASDRIQLDLQIDGSIHDLSLEFMDLSGRIVAVHEINDPYFFIPVSELNTGPYIVVLKRGAEAISRTIFVKVDR